MLFRLYLVCVWRDAVAFVCLPTCCACCAVIVCFSLLLFRASVFSAAYRSVPETSHETIPRSLYFRFENLSFAVFVILAWNDISTAAATELTIDAHKFIKCPEFDGWTQKPTANINVNVWFVLTTDTIPSHRMHCTFLTLVTCVHIRNVHNERREKQQQQMWSERKKIT